MEKISSSMKHYYNNRRPILAKQHQYYEENKGRILKRCASYRKINSKKIKEKSKKYRLKNKEAYKIYQLKYRALNRDHLLQQKKEWKLKNLPRIITERKEYYQQNKDYIKSKSKKQYERTKFKFRYDVLRYYSNGIPECACCGYDEFPFLTIDHINGWKKAGHKRRIGGNNLILWIRKNKYPKGFQVLCFNCNISKGAFGECCHKKPYDPTINRDRKARFKVIQHYSPNLKCACCGENNLGFLTIDHINGREYKGRNIGKTYRGLTNKGFPIGYQILCYNCNCAKSNKAECPHKSQSLKPINN